MWICHPDDRKGLNPLNRLLKCATKKRGRWTPLFYDFYHSISGIANQKALDKPHRQIFQNALTHQL